MLIVLDSNVFISAIIKDSITRKIILSSSHKFLLPEYSFIEIKNHFNEILHKSRLSQEEFNSLIKNLIKYIKIVRTEDMIKHKEEAREIIGKIDENDILFIACALTHPKSIIWSNDGHFKLQKIIKVYDTRGLMELFPS